MSEGEGDLKRRDVVVCDFCGLLESWSNFLTTVATEVEANREGRGVKPIDGVCGFAERK